MSEERIVYKLYENRRKLRESEFSVGRDTYKCVFGRYYKNSEEISRDEYFKARDSYISRSTVASNMKEEPKKKSYEEYTPEEFDNELEDIESELEDLSSEISDVPYSKRGRYDSKLEDIRNKLSDMEEYLSDEQYEKSEELLKTLWSIVNDESYDGPSEEIDPYNERGLRRSDFY